MPQALPLHAATPHPPLPQKYTRVPQELQYSNSDILLAADDPGREQQQQLLQRVAADEADERDWRARSTLPPAPAAAAAPASGAAPAAQQQGGAGWRPDQQPAAAAAGGAGGAGGEAAKIQKAADIGRTAWHAGTAVEGADQTLRKVRGGGGPLLGARRCCDPPWAEPLACCCIFCESKQPGSWVSAIRLASWCCAVEGTPLLRTHAHPAQQLSTRSMPLPVSRAPAHSHALPSLLPPSCLAPAGQGHPEQADAREV